jgi:hypothetical protein
MLYLKHCVETVTEKFRHDQDMPADAHLSLCMWALIFAYLYNTCILQQLLH